MSAGIAALLTRGLGFSEGVKYAPTGGLSLAPSGPGTAKLSPVITRGLGSGVKFVVTGGLYTPGTPPPTTEFVATGLVWSQPVPQTLQMWVDINGNGSAGPFTFDCSKTLSTLGPGFVITGTPVVEWVGGGQFNDPALTVGAPLIDPVTQAKVQVTITGSAAAALTSLYRFSCTYTAGDGTSSFRQVARGSLVVLQVR